MILVRHGETVFNVVFGATRVDPGVNDPALTPQGRTQAEAVAAALAAEGVRRLIASPYRRALETADILARILSVPVAVEPLVRERAKFACDVGTPRSALAREWRHFVFDHIDDMWWSAAEEPEASLAARCGAFARSMAATPDWRDVAVITHWGVIRCLTGVRPGNCELVRFDPTADSTLPPRAPE